MKAYENIFARIAKSGHNTYKSNRVFKMKNFMQPYSLFQLIITDCNDTNNSEFTVFQFLPLSPWTFDTSACSFSIVQNTKTMGIYQFTGIYFDAQVSTILRGLEHIINNVRSDGYVLSEICLWTKWLWLHCVRFYDNICSRIRPQHKLHLGSRTWNPDANSFWQDYK